MVRYQVPVRGWQLHSGIRHSIPCTETATGLFGGQFAELSKELQKNGGRLDISYKFNPPLWRSKSATDTCVLSIEHLKGIASVKSMEQAVVDAIEGRNATTIKDIRSALQNIEKHLAAMSSGKSLHNRRAGEEGTGQVFSLAGYCGVLGADISAHGAVFEVRQGYKSKDSKR